VLKLADVNNVSCVCFRETFNEINDIRTRPTEAICILEQSSCHLWFSCMQIWTLKIEFMLWGSGILICYRTTTNANPPNLTLPPPCCTKPLACSFECRTTHWNNSKKWRQDLPTLPVGRHSEGNSKTTISIIDSEVSCFFLDHPYRHPML